MHVRGLRGCANTCRHVCPAHVCAYSVYPCKWPGCVGMHMCVRVQVLRLCVRTRVSSSCGCHAHHVCVRVSQWCQWGHSSASRLPAWAEAGVAQGPFGANTLPWKLLESQTLSSCGPALTSLPSPPHPEASTLHQHRFLRVWPPSIKTPGPGEMHIPGPELVGPGPWNLHFITCSGGLRAPWALRFPASSALIPVAPADPQLLNQMGETRCLGDPMFDRFISRCPHCRDRTLSPTWHR